MDCILKIKLIYCGLAIIAIIILIWKQKFFIGLRWPEVFKRDMRNGMKNYDMNKQTFKNATFVHTPNPPKKSTLKNPNPLPKPPHVDISGFQITTKFRPNQKVLMLMYGKVWPVEIESVNAKVDHHNQKHIQYWVHENPAGSHLTRCFNEWDLFETKEELFKSL
jgi:hypothetical protein